MAIDIRTLNHGPLEPTVADATTSADVGQPSTPAENGVAQSGLKKVAADYSSSTVDQASRVSGRVEVGASPALVSSAPDLPDPVGTRAPMNHATTLVATTTAFDTSPSQIISAAEAFDLIQRAGQRGYELASVFNRIANHANISAKTSEAKHLKDQVDGEREHANTALVGAVAGAGLGAFVGIRGASMMRSDAGDARLQPKVDTGAKPVIPDSRTNLPSVSSKPTSPDKNPSAAGSASSAPHAHAAPTVIAREPIRARANATHPAGTHQNTVPAPVPARPDSNVNDTRTPADMQQRDVGGGISQMGQPVSNVVTTAFDTYDKTSANGGQYQADQAKIAQENDTVASAIAQTTVDSSKSSLDQAQDAIKAGQQAVASYAERQAQVINNIANR